MQAQKAQRFPWQLCLYEMGGTAVLVRVITYHFESDRDGLFRRLGQSANAAEPERHGQSARGGAGLRT